MLTRGHPQTNAIIAGNQRLLSTLPPVRLRIYTYLFKIYQPLSPTAKMRKRNFPVKAFGDNRILCSALIWPPFRTIQVFFHTPILTCPLHTLEKKANEPPSLLPNCDRGIALILRVGNSVSDQIVYAHPFQILRGISLLLDLSLLSPFIVPDNRLYRVHVGGKPVEGLGPYEDEDTLVDALVEINRSAKLESSELVVHVYETDATPLGIGRKYLGSIEGQTVLMMGEVDEKRVRGT
jgi:hypothetical protein